MAERHYLPRFGSGADALVDAQLADILADAIYDASNLIGDGRIQLAREVLRQTIHMLLARSDSDG